MSAAAQSPPPNPEVTEKFKLAKVEVQMVWDRLASLGAVTIKKNGIEYLVRVIYEGKGDDVKYGKCHFKSEKQRRDPN
jgi:hypothetical protein